MNAFDAMYLLFTVAVVALILAAIDGAVMVVLHLRRRRLLKRFRKHLCACGEWPAPAYFAGVVHEPARCYPQMESS